MRITIASYSFTHVAMSTSYLRHHGSNLVWVGHVKVVMIGTVVVAIERHCSWHFGGVYVALCAFGCVAMASSYARDGCSNFVDLNLDPNNNPNFSD